jgi:3-phosphoglycerate kinase
MVAVEQFTAGILLAVDHASGGGGAWLEYI